MRRFALSVAWLALLGAAAAAQALHVTPLAREGRLFVSFQLAEGLTEDVRAVIQSGLATTFSYDVDLKRSSAFWLDRTIASAVVSATVKYDTLTRKYSVSRAIDGRMDWADTTDSEETVRQWLTSFEKLPLFSSGPLEANAEYYVRVRASTSPRNAWFLFPWGHEIAGLARFTFLP